MCLLNVVKSKKKKRRFYNHLREVCKKKYKFQKSIWSDLKKHLYSYVKLKNISFLGFLNNFLKQIANK